MKKIGLNIFSIKKGDKSKKQNLNNLFCLQYKQNLIDEFTSFMGSSRDCKYSYTLKECIDIVMRYDNNITNYCNQFSISKELVQAVLLRQLWSNNILDKRADIAVREYFQCREKWEYWDRLTASNWQTVSFPKTLAAMRNDCKTGIGKIYIREAIDVINYAVDKGLICSKKYNSYNWHDCYEVWNSLHNEDYSIKIMTLKIYYCADILNDFNNSKHFCKKNIEEILLKYNGSQGECEIFKDECNKYYKIFKKYSRLKSSEKV